MTVATNRYLDYWFDLYESYQNQKGEAGEVFFQVFTDQKSDVLKFCKANQVTNVSVISIPQYVWPEATMLRYEIFANLGNFDRDGIYAHIDADMFFLDFANIQKLLKGRKKDLIFVRHPGFFRPRGFSILSFYGRNPLYIFKDIYLFIRFGGLGAWETNRNSQAYIPYSQRRNYCCGGVWLGTRESIVEICNQLSLLVKKDIKRGVSAKWHDESFLNKYLSISQNIEVVGPELCFVDGYPQLSGILPLIKALEKGTNKTR